MLVPSFGLMLGPPLVATWLNCALYGFELILAWSYWKTPGNDAKINRWVVSAVVLVDTVGTMCSCAVVYFYCVNAWGNFISMFDAPLTMGVCLVATSLCQNIVAAFFCYRIYLLMRDSFSRWVLWPLLLILGLLTLTATACGLAAGIITPGFVSPSKEKTLKTFFTIYASASTIVAVVVGLLQTGLFLKLRKKLSNLGGQGRADAILSQLIKVAVASGSIPAGVTIVATLLFVYTSSFSNFAAAVGFISGRLYSLSLLGNLEMRKIYNQERPVTTIRVPIDLEKQRTDVQLGQETPGSRIDGSFMYSFPSLGPFPPISRRASQDITMTLPVSRRQSLQDVWKPSREEDNRSLNHIRMEEFIEEIAFTNISPITLR